MKSHSSCYNSSPLWFSDWFLSVGSENWKEEYNIILKYVAAQYYKYDQV